MIWEMNQCKHSWLITTYDDSPEIRKNFVYANVYEWQLQYGMNTITNKAKRKGARCMLTKFQCRAENVNHVNSQFPD